MPAAPADSALYRDLFGDADTAQLFTDSAEVRAMLLVEGALAGAQGQLGLIPADAAAFLQRACMEVQLDPAGLAAATATNGVPVPALVAAFRKATDAPEYSRFLHWGATSQDIMDTALALRLKRLIPLWLGRIDAVLAELAKLAEDHADLAMAGRTYGQAATPTSFGSLVAGWGRPLMRQRERLVALQPDLCRVSLSGAAGTLSAMGTQGPAVRAGLAKALGLGDPGASWHSERDTMAAFAGWMAGVTGSLAKMGEDLVLLTQSGLSEIALAGAGGSSTMPQKQNPVGPSVLVALARQTAALSTAMQGAAIHRQQRDGAAWFTEWLTLPQMIHSTARALALAADVARAIRPQPEAMAAGLRAGHDTILAEALTFALSETMPRPDAAARVSALCKRALNEARSLLDLAAMEFPGTDWHQRLQGPALLGTAAQEARAFAAGLRDQA